MDKDKEDDTPKVSPQVVYVTPTPQPAPEDDTIDLRDLWNTLMRRKWIVVATAVLVLAASFVYIFTATPVFEAHAYLRVGWELTRDDGSKGVYDYFESLDEMLNRLTLTYVESGKNCKLPLAECPRITDVSLQEGSSSTLLLEAQGATNQAAVDLLKTVTANVLEEHKQLYNTRYNSLMDSITLQSTQLDILENTKLPQMKTNLDIYKDQELKRLNEKKDFLLNNRIPQIQDELRANELTINHLQERIDLANVKSDNSSQGDDTNYMLLALRVSNLQDQISNLTYRNISLRETLKSINDIELPDIDRDLEKLVNVTIPEKEQAIEEVELQTIPEVKASLSRLKVKIEEPELTPSQIVGDIVSSEYPVKPKKKQILAVGLVAGVMLGIFLAFFLEFLKPKKTEE